MTINFNCVKINRIFVIPNYEFRIKLAGVAELADALDSDSNGSNTLWVQVPFSAPNGINPNLFIVGDGFGFILFCEYPNSNCKMK